MCRDRFPTKNQDLAGFGQNRGQVWGEKWPGGVSYGSPGAGIQLGGSVLGVGCDLGPCWAILGHGGSVRGHFPYFRGVPYFSDYFSYYYRCGWPIITGVAGLLLPDGEIAILQLFGFVAMLLGSGDFVFASGDLF